MVNSYSGVGRAHLGLDLVGAKQQKERENIVTFNRILVDTSFLFGIFSNKDQYHERSIAVLDALGPRSPDKEFFQEMKRSYSPMI